MGRDSRFPTLSRMDALREDSRGRDGRRVSPKHRVSKSPIRGPRDIDFHASRSRRSRSHDVHRGRSVSRERRGRSPPGRATPPRVAGRAATRPSAELPGELVGRHAAEGFRLGNRNETLGRQTPTPFPSGTVVKGTGDMLGNQGDPSLNSYGMLVPRSLVLEDGTVRTFYTLPPDPSLDALPPSADDGLRGNMLPAYVESRAIYVADPRYPLPDGFPLGDLNRRDLIAEQDRRLTDGKMPGNQYAAGDGGLPAWPGSLELEHPSASRRERPPSPNRNAMDLRSQRRASRSPLREDFLRFGREGAPKFFERDGYAEERSTRTTDIGRRGLSDGPKLSFRERFASPRRSGPGEDPRANGRSGGGYIGNPRHEEPMRVLEDGRLGLRRGAPLVYPRDADNYSREVISPRDGRGGIPRSSRYMEDPMYEQDMRQVRSPPPEPLGNFRRAVEPQRRVSAFRDNYMSPRRIDDVSPKQRRPVTPPFSRHEPPPDFYDRDRNPWKRKFADRDQGSFKSGRSFGSEKPEFKRARDGDLHPDDEFFRRRNPGLRRPDVYVDRRAEREDDGLDHGNYFGPRPRRRFSPPYFEDGRRGDFDDNKPIRFHKEGGAFADRSRSWHGTDMQSEFVQEDEQQNVPDLPEDSPEFKQQIHRAYMKYAKALNENPGQRRRYEEQGKAGTLLCLVCSRLSKNFVDTHSLVMHTHMSQKRGLRAEHLGLCKAICTVMGWNSVIDPGNGKSYQNLTIEEAKANKEDLILWPPAVVIHNAFAGNTTDGQAAHSGVKGLLKELGLSLEKIKIADGRQGTVIVKYLATLSCLHEAERLHQHFTANSHGREDWLRVQPDKKESDNVDADEGLDFTEEDAETKQKKRVLYGYLALAHDLDKVDLDFRRRGLVRSRKEIESIADDSLIS